MVDIFKKKIQRLKDNGSVLLKSKYDELKQAIQRGIFLEYCANNDIEKLTPSGANLLDIAILYEDYWLVARLIEELKERDDGILKKLLVKQSINSPLLAAAALEPPKIFNLLLEQDVGFTIEELEAAKEERSAVLGHQRFWGRMAIGAFLKSACPSESLADTLNVSETVAGFGFVVGAGILGAVSLPLIASGALVGLACITFANMRKLWIERTIQNEELNTAILLAQLKNYEKRIEAYENKTASDLTVLEKELLRKDLTFFKDKMQEHRMKNIARFSVKNKKNLLGFLTGWDKFFTATSTFGDILCTNAGFLSIGAYFFVASAFVVGLPWVVLTLTAMAMIGVSIFYLLENKTQRREFAEQRRVEFDLRISRYKSFKNFINHQGYGLSRVFSLLKTGDAVQDKDFEESFNPIFDKFKKTSSKNFEEEYNAFVALNPDAKIQKIHQIVIDGKRELFNHLIEKGIDLSLLAVTPNGLKTLLHHTVEQGHSVMAEEMLGVSITAQNRMLKEMWPESIKNRKQVAENYRLLFEKTKTWLVTRDASNLLPLHYAAKKRDASLYLLLLQQPVPYTKADLDEAAKLRKQWIRGEKNWLLTSALVESICPGTSVSEVVFSLSFAVFVGASSVLTWGIGLAAVLIYAMVAAGNYHKTKVERGITTDLEQLTLDSARVSSVNLRLRILLATVTNPAKMTADAITKANVELSGLRSELEDLKKLYPIKNDTNSLTPASGFRSKLQKFVKPLGRAIRTYGGTLGTFLCGYAGTLGIIELVATAASLVITGPVGWGLLGAGAFIGLIYAGFYFKNRKNELKIFAARTLKVTQDKEDLAAIVSNPKMANVIEDISLALGMQGITTQQSAMQQLNRHKDHPGCDLRRLVNLPEAQVAQVAQVAPTPAPAQVPVPAAAPIPTQQSASQNLAASAP